MDKAVNLEGSVSDLHDKLSSMHSENSANDDLVLKHIKVAEEAIAGWEKAEAEAVFLKQELDEVLRQRITAEERIADLDAALKECMQQLRFDREEQERKTKVAVMQICREHEHDWKVLEEKLEETSKRLAKSEYENSHLSKTLQTKEKMIEDLFKLKSEVERNFNQLVLRLDSEEKSNLRLSDASQKEHKCNMAKIIKLEKECQRLRLLVQKQLPRPATLEGLKSEVLGKELEEFNNQTFSLMLKNFTSPNSPDKRINFLLEKLCSMEEETRILKESVAKKNNEINSLKITSANAASNLWSSSKSLTGTELATGTSHDPSLTSFSESGFEDEISCAESWASALVTELQQITTRNSKGASTSKRVGLSGMNLMDDFVEMEKLAAVSVNKAFERSSVNESITGMYSSGTNLCLQPSASSGKELKPDSHLGSGETSHGIQQKKVLIGIYPSWIQDILRLALQQVHSTKKHPNEVLDELGNALAQIFTIPSKVNDAKENEGCSNSGDTISWAPRNVPQMANSLQESVEIISPIQIQQSDVSKSIRRIIKLIEGIDQSSLTDYSSPTVPDANGSSLAYNKSASSTEYIVRVFQWKGSELRAILQRFVHTCNDLINGKASLENFPKELSSSLEWIFNHCFSVQDVSRMRDTVKQHFDWDDSESESELGSVIRCPQLVAERVYAFDEHLYSRSSAGINGQTNYSQPKEVQLKLKEENTILKQKLLNMESVQKDLEGKLQLETEKIEDLLIQLRESEECVGSFQTKLERKGIVENQTENPRFLRDDPDSKLTVTRNKLGMVYQNSLSLELELENKINRCQELETTCIELQLQLDSVAKGDVQKYDASVLDEQLQTDQELSAASEKLSECQETILSLGKQLKALASPKEAVPMEKVVSVTPATVTKSKSATHRCSLLDQMLFEDNTDSVKQKESIHPVGDPEKSLAHPSGIPGTACGPDGQVRSQGKLPCPNEPKYKDKDGAGRAVAIVPNKRCGAVSLLRLITRRRKRENDKKSLTMVG